MQHPLVHLARCIAVCATAGWMAGTATTAGAQTEIGSAFTYQGKLQQSGEPFDGEATMTFRLFGTDEGGSTLAPDVTVDDVQVSSGVFTVDLDFGDDAFPDEARWVEIEVEGTLLEPRQRLRPVPYALYALDGNEGPPGPQGPEGPEGPEGPMGAEGPEGASPFHLVNGDAVYTDGNVGIGTTSPFGRLGVSTQEGLAARLLTQDSEALRLRASTDQGNGIVDIAQFWAGNATDPEPGMSNRVLFRLQASNGGFSLASALKTTWVNPEAGNARANFAIQTLGDDGANDRLVVTHDGTTELAGDLHVEGDIRSDYLDTSGGVGSTSTALRGNYNVEFSKGMNAPLPNPWFRFWNEDPDTRQEQFRITTSGNATLRGTLTQDGFDLAESFLRTDDAAPGQLTGIHPDNPHAVRLATSEDGGAVIGVVSTAPGLLLGGAGMDVEALRAAWGEEVHQLFEEQRGSLRGVVGEKNAALVDLAREMGEKASDGAPDERASLERERNRVESQIEAMMLEEFAERHLVQVALAGRVPVRVDASHGEIKPGDYLTAGPTPGTAVKATRPGPVIGTALEGHSGEEGEIIAFIHRGHYNPASHDEAEALREEIDNLTNRLERLEAMLGGE